jgi:hypothetical protein
MSYAEELLNTYPHRSNDDAELLAGAIDASGDCAQACTANADADLAEPNVADLIGCIGMCLDCAVVCTATSAVLSRRTGRDANVTRALLEACVAACESCGNECERHAHMHEHCRVCGLACRRCERACRELLGR